MIFSSSYQLIQSPILLIQAHILSSLCSIIYSVSYPTLISLFLIFHLVCFLSSVSFYSSLQPEGTSGEKCVLMTHHNNNCRFKTQLQKHTHHQNYIHRQQTHPLHLVLLNVQPHPPKSTHTCTCPMQTHRQPLFAQGRVLSSKHTLNLWHNINSISTSHSSEEEKHVHFSVSTRV